MLRSMPFGFAEVKNDYFINFRIPNFTIAGLVGAFIFVLLWPGFFALNYFGWEKFELPASSNVWGYIALNAIVGTVLSEVLWLW